MLIGTENNEKKQSNERTPTQWTADRRKSMTESKESKHCTNCSHESKEARHSRFTMWRRTKTEEWREEQIRKRWKSRAARFAEGLRWGRAEIEEWRERWGKTNIGICLSVSQYSLAWGKDKSKKNVMYYSCFGSGIGSSIFKSMNPRTEPIKIGLSRIGLGWTRIEEKIRTDLVSLVWFVESIRTKLHP